MVDIVTRAGKGSPLTNNEVDANFTNLAEVSGITGEPMGHEDRTTSTISFNASTRTFTIAPVNTSFTVWCKGKKVVVSSAQTVTIPNTSGMYSIYFDANGALAAKAGYFTFSEEAPTAYVYWNATTGAAPYFGDERHGVVLDWQTHEYLHRTRGAALASGFGASGYTLGGNGTSNAHAQLTLEGGTFFDEDMKIIVTATNTPTAGTWEQDLLSPARIPVLYLSGTGWVIDAPTDYPLKQGTARPQYNALSGGVWSTADVANNKYATSWILATNNLTYPVIAIIGQAESDLQSAAEAVDFTSLQLPGFPSVEFRPLYRLVFQCADSFSNAVKASLVSITDIRSIAAAGVAASLITDHGNLSGLSDDDHPQYLSVDTVRVSLTAAVKASFLPSQAGNAGKFLTTDATSTSWAALTSGNITTALGFTPYNATNPAGYITGITSSNVTTALGFTPYNATNPSGYVTAAGARGAISVTGAGSYDSATGVINIVGGVTSFNTRTGAITLSSADVTTALGFTPYNSTNPNGYLTGITSTQVTTALGYTPYNSTNPNGYITGITSGMVTTALGFTPYDNSNPSGYITSSALSGYLTSASAASTYLPLSGGTMTGPISYSAVTGNKLAFYFAANDKYGIDVQNSELRIYSGAAGDPTGGITFGKHNGTTFTEWMRVQNNGTILTNGNQVLHAGNYGSYALPLTGGTVSGLTTFTHTTASDPLSAVHIVGGGTHTGLFINPAASSQAHIRFGTAGTLKWQFRVPFQDGVDSDLKYFSWVAANDIYTFSHAGNAVASSSWRAPIFYDSNNTAYYTDPNGNSNLRQLTIDGPSSTQLTVRGAEADIWLNSTGPNTTWRILGSTGASTHLFRIYDHTNSSDRLNINANGNVTAFIDVRAPIFYDGANTGYYVDPASTSNLNSTISQAFRIGTDSAWKIRGNSGNVELAFEYSTSSTLGDGNIRAYLSGSTFVAVGDVRAPIFYDSNNTGFYVDPASISVLSSLRLTSENALLIFASNGAYQRVDTRNDSSASRAHWYGVLSDGNTSNFRHAWYDGSAYFNVTAASGSITFSRVGGGGNVTSDESFRAPIFYDSDNTGYYANFADTTTSINVNGSIVINNGGGSNTHGLKLNGANSRIWFDGRRAIEGDAAGNNFQLGEGFVFTTINGQTRSPIFYDSNDTGYFIDPSNGGFNLRGGTSNRVTLTTNDSGFKVTNAEGNGVADVRLGAAWGSPGIYSSSSIYLMSEASVYFKIGSADKGYMDSSSNLFAYGSMRSPIFYDSNNTAYYGDFENISSMYGVAVRGDTSSTDSRNQIFLWGGGDTTTSAIGFKANGGEFPNPTGNGDGYNTYFTMDSNGRGWVFRQGVGGSDFNALTTSGWITNNGTWQSNGSMRAPIFYDSNDTGYYDDPNGTGNISSLNIRGTLRLFSSEALQIIAPNQARQRADSRDESSDSRTHWYGLTTSGGTSNFRHAWYDGSAYFNVTASSGAITFSRVGGGGNVTTDESFRAPLFYDNNNTAYYGDFASTSRINTITFDRFQSTSYDTPNQLVTASDINWTYGCHYDGGSTYYMQVKFYGTGDDSRGFRVLNVNGSTVVWRVNGAGNSISSGNVTAYSDERLKTNWQPMPENYVSRLAQIKVGIYDRIDGSKLTQVGVGAQSLQTLLPQAVDKSDDEMGTLSVNYGSAALASAVELAKEVVDLRARVAHLESLINKLIGD